MLKKIILAALIGLSAIGTVHAEQKPVGFKEDVRIKRYVYDENNVYKLKLHLKAVTALQFEDDEIVESILIGDSASWEVVKLKMGNVISLKPIVDNVLTNMTVYTDERVYTFELHADGEIREGVKKAADHSFRIAFTYPKKFEPVDTTQTPPKGKINDKYLVAGKAAFRPVRIQDDGVQTTFTIPRGSPRPAIFRVGGDRKEALVNSRTEGRKIIVDGVSEFWVMRIGGEMVCVGKQRAVKLLKKRGAKYDG